MVLRKTHSKQRNTDDEITIRQVTLIAWKRQGEEAIGH